MGRVGPLGTDAQAVEFLPTASQPQFERFLTSPGEAELELQLVVLPPCGLTLGEIQKHRLRLGGPEFEKLEAGRILSDRTGRATPRGPRSIVLETLLVENPAGRGGQRAETEQKPKQSAGASTQFSRHRHQLRGRSIVLADALYGDKAQEALEKAPARWIILGAALIALGMNFLNRNDTSSSGVFLGTVAGFVFADRRVQFRTPGSLGNKVLCYLLGMAVTGILYFGLKALFPGKGDDNYDLFRFVRYGALGLWVSLGAPWVFVRLGLMEGLGGKATKSAEIR